MIEKKTGKEIFDEIKKLQDTMDNKYLKQFIKLNKQVWISEESLIKNLKKRVQEYSLVLAGIEDNQEVYSDDELKTTKDINELRAIIDELEALIKYVQ